LLQLGDEFGERRLALADTSTGPTPSGALNVAGSQSSVISTVLTRPPPPSFAMLITPVVANAAAVNTAIPNNLTVRYFMPPPSLR
jgi:hypothetical protein